MPNPNQEKLSGLWINKTKSGDTYFSGNLQGRLYTLEMLKEHIEKEIKEVQDMISKTPTGKVLNNLTQSK